MKFYHLGGTPKSVEQYLWLVNDVENFAWVKDQFILQD